MFDEVLNQRFDFNLNIKNNFFNKYLVYVHILNTYNKIKNKTKI